MTAPIAVKRTLIVTLLAIGIIPAYAQLAANFTANPLSGCIPVVVNFTDQSTGGPNQWRWDLGNGTISFNQNPSCTYFTPGQYNIKLVIRNAAGNADSLTKLQYITVNAQPTVAFLGNPLMGCFPLPVQFSDLSNPVSGTISSWQWDFGDGYLSAVQHPTHTYTAAGNFNVTLRVTNTVGCIKSLTKTQYIRTSAGVHAAFTNNNPNSCLPPATISFQNQSTGSGALTYQWTFGDGGTATTANPIHVYVSAGTYTVRLIVSNATGCRDTIIKPNLIVVGSIVAGFTSADSICVNRPLSFTNTSVPPPITSAWDFGDGSTSTVLNPVKVYATAGPRLVRLIVGMGGCFDTTRKTVIVLDKPVTGFTNSNSTSCSAPLTVTFNNTSPGFGYTYNWNFGDGGFSTLANPVHTYTTTGTFDVTLIVTNATGCSDTLRKQALVKIQAPHASINNLPQRNCAPLTWTFTSTNTSIDPIVSYLWDFGDGFTSTIASPTHVFAAGTYDIKLIIITAGNCTDTAIVLRGIIASIKPVPNFSATPLDACAHVPIQFTDLTTGTVTQWLWNFGDGGTSTAQNPSHVYEDTGYFNVQLIVWNEGCSDTIRFTHYIHINPPIAAFTIGLNCTLPKTRTFLDQSIGADTWNWDFGDGNTSTLQSPVHTYTNTGNYTITLVVFNSVTGCSYTRTHTTNVVIEKADFRVSDSVICRKSTVTFSALNTTPANVSAYQWTFGDGGSASGVNVNHTYNLSGQYTVRLILTDINNCRDTLIKTQYITVNGPTAGFSVTTPGNCMLSTIFFTDQSVGDGTHPINSWVWYYGDGINETLFAPPFSHQYTSAGVYNISLKITDTQGCIDSVMMTNAVTVSKPVAIFSSVDTASCPNKIIHFSNTSTGPSLNYSWDFGDGATSTAAAPNHTYTADGWYTIRLLVIDQYGCRDSLIKPAYIKITTPHADFTMSDSIATCPPLLVNFTNTSNSYTTETWDFGDGISTQTTFPSHFYSIAGTYFAKLTITSNGGCVDSIVKRIVISGPSGSFGYGPLIGCEPLTVNFSASTQDRLSFVWDFSDGNVAVTSDSLISHTYTLPGYYLPKMILIDPTGCQVPIFGGDTISVKGATANFGFLNQPLCDAGPVAFTDSTIGTDPIATYAWNFGDGGTATIQNPIHTYSTTGTYYPQLIITTLLGCTDTAQSIVPVKIVASPQAAYTHSGNGCAPLTVQFNGLLNIPDSSVVSWNWSFGNGNNSNLQIPTAQLYSINGSYPIQLIATNSTGCKDTVTGTIESYLVPTIQAGTDTLICRGTGITLNALGADTYTWTPAIGLSCNNCASPLANPDSITTYIVKGTTIHGCSNMDTITIDVKQHFVMRNNPGDTLCKGGSVRLFASGAYAYTWWPSTGLNSTTSPTPLATPANSTIYRVIGTDDRGCFQDTGYVNVRVFPIPTVNAGLDQTINVGQSIELKPVISGDVSNVIWIPTNSIVSSNYPAVLVKPNVTTEYTVEARNPGGCKSKDKVTVFVVCNGANVFIPNTFSPNGDGVNDIFYPRGTGLFSIKSFRIFNRWGQLVYEKGGFMPNDASAGWNGSFNGQRLNPDVYVYMVDIVCDNSNVLTFKGDVALIQ